MNRIQKLTALVSVLALSSVASYGITVSSFSDDFESGIGKWTTTNGQIVSDPVDVTNNVLNFSASKGGGDAFSNDRVTSGGSYIIEFDYYGSAGSVGGGFVGYSMTTGGSNNWLFGNAYSSDDGPVIELASNGSWAHYSRTFTALGTAPFHLMVEDFVAPGENAYFDNFSFRAVPDTGSSLALLGLGLIVLVGFRRRFSK